MHDTAMLEKHATLRQRFLAKMVDWGILVMPLLYLFYTYGQMQRPEPEVWVVASMASIFTGLFIIFFLQCVLIGTMGQSLGKIVMRIRIVDEKTKKVGSFTQNLVLRTWLNAVMWENLVYFFADHLMLLRKERRCLHDYLAGTTVIKVR